MKMLFQQYTDNRARICRLQRTDCSLADAVRGSRTSAPYTMHTVRIRGVDREMWNHVQERLRTLSEACRTAEEAAEAAPEPVEPGFDGDAAIRDAVRALPEKLRIAVILHYMEGYPVGEVARILRIPAETVKSRLRRARALLRDTLEG